MSTSFKKTKKLALCALLAGLSFAILFLGTVAGILDLCAVVVGALCTAFAVIEFGSVYPWLVCAVTSVLALLFLPDKTVALEYIFLGGVYPVIKSLCEKNKPVISWLIKLVYFNAALTAFILLVKYVLSVSDQFNIIIWAGYLIGNVFFVIYDYALTTFISAYLIRFRKKLKIKDMH